jgi:hypothetical protein
VPIPAAYWLPGSLMFYRLTVLCWGLILGVIPIMATLAWIATGDTKVFIMIPGALLFVGAPWFVFWVLRIIITGRWI